MPLSKELHKHIQLFKNINSGNYEAMIAFDKPYGKKKERGELFALNATGTIESDPKTAVDRLIADFDMAKLREGSNPMPIMPTGEQKEIKL